MKIKLEQYETEKDYINKENAKVTKWATVIPALEFAKKEVRKYRGTDEFIGFLLYNRYGELSYKLPSN